MIKCIGKNSRVADLARRAKSRAGFGLPAFARSIFAASALFSLVIAFFFMIYSVSSGVRGGEFRQKADNEITPVAELAILAKRDARERGVRRGATGEALNPALIHAGAFVAAAPNLIDKALSRSPTAFPQVAQNAPRALAPLLPLDGVTSPALYATVPAGNFEALDEDGAPLRWRLADNFLAGYSPKKPVEKRAPEPDRLPRFNALPATRGHAGNYRAIVENFASRFNLSPDLVMAIIHSESDFSPTLVSNKSAMGLMQLLPSTASDEVHRFLYGRRGQVSFAELSVPETNIRYGTAYLHILLNRYFPDVQNRDVQEHCVIAAYNMGPNRFLRLYGPTPARAVEKINSMSPEDFYNDLYSRLPARETRYFVNKVRQMKRHYARLPDS